VLQNTAVYVLLLVFLHNQI